MCCMLTAACRCCVGACFAAQADSRGLRTIKAAGSAAPAIEFGAVQTQQAGSAADVRRKFAGQ
jgi:hypothetical protein